MANIANVKVKAGNVLELSGSSVSISGSGGLSLHTQNGGITADAGTGAMEITAGNGVEIKGNLVVSGNIEAHRLDIITTETIISSSVLYRNGSTRMGNDENDLHEFSGSLIISGAAGDEHAAIKLENGYFSGSGTGLTNIPNKALINSTIAINGLSASLGSSITTVAAGFGLAEKAPNLGKIELRVSASGTDSGIDVGETGISLSSSVVRNDRHANFGDYNVTASTFVGALKGTADKVANAVTFTSSAGNASGTTFDGSAAIEVGYQTLGAATTCLLYTSPSPRDKRQSRMPSSA